MYTWKCLIMIIIMQPELRKIVSGLIESPLAQKFRDCKSRRRMRACSFGFSLKFLSQDQVCSCSLSIYFTFIYSSCSSYSSPCRLLLLMN